MITISSTTTTTKISKNVVWYGRHCENFPVLFVNPTEHSIDEKRLHRTLKDAGLYAYGLQGIAVWVFDDDQDRLVSIPGGFWYNENIVQPSEELQRLTDNTRSDHVPMKPVAPGTDIAGLLWLESNTHEKISSFIHSVTSLPQMAHQHLINQSNNHRMILYPLSLILITTIVVVVAV